MSEISVLSLYEAITSASAGAQQPTTSYLTLASTGIATGSAHMGTSNTYSTGTGLSIQLPTRTNFLTFNGGPFYGSPGANYAVDSGNFLNFRDSWLSPINITNNTTGVSNYLQFATPSNDLSNVRIVSANLGAAWFFAHSNVRLASNYLYKSGSITYASGADVTYNFGNKWNFVVLQNGLMSVNGKDLQPAPKWTGNSNINPINPTAGQSLSPANISAYLVSGRIANLNTRSTALTMNQIRHLSAAAMRDLVYTVGTSNLVNQPSTWAL